MTNSRRWDGVKFIAALLVLHIMLYVIPHVIRLKKIVAQTNRRVGRRDTAVMVMQMKREKRSKISLQHESKSRKTFIPLSPNLPEIHLENLTVRSL